METPLSSCVIRSSRGGICSFTPAPTTNAPEARRSRVCSPHGADVQFLQLLWAHRGGCIDHQVNSLSRLGKGDYLAQALLPGQNHGNAVQAQSDAPMGRGAVGKRFEEKPEARPRLLFAHA